MAEYLSITELSAKSGLSVATLNRLKKAGQIPFFQPGGHRKRVLFPADALERVQTPHSNQSDSELRVEHLRLAGPSPKWMDEVKAIHGVLRGAAQVRMAPVTNLQAPCRCQALPGVIVPFLDPPGSDFKCQKNENTK